MTTYQFATCDRQRALGFIAAVYPNCEISDTAESAGPLLALVERDIVRIQDPEYHAKNNTIQVVAGKNWKDGHRDMVVAAGNVLAAQTGHGHAAGESP